MTADKKSMAQSNNVLPFPKKINQNVTFKEFGMAAMAGDISLASELIAKLLEVPKNRAEEVAQHFFKLYTQDPGVLMQTMQIRDKIVAGDHNGALLLVSQLFGLNGPEAIAALAVIEKLIPKA